MSADRGREAVRDRLRYWASVQPQKPFLRCGSDWWSYREVAEASGQLAGGLQRAGPRMVGPTPDYPAVVPGDLYSIMYTSGTTGMPKGCLMSNGYYLTIARGLVTAGWIEHDDILFTTYQLFHTSGQIYGLTAALNVGASVIVEPWFSASQYMQRVRETGATVVYGPGAMGLALLAQPPHSDDAVNRLRLAMWLPMTAAKQAEFEERFGTRVTSETYGQTEVLIPAMSSLSDERRPGTAGRVTPYFDLRLVDEQDDEVPVGEIVVRPKVADGMFREYWRDPAATALAWRGLWHHTGDLGRLDKDGYLTFVDRKKDSLRRRGRTSPPWSSSARSWRTPGSVRSRCTRSRRS